MNTHAPFASLRGLVPAALVGLLAFAGCEQNPGDAVTAVKDAGNKAAESVRDAGEKAAESVREAGEKAAASVSEAGSAAMESAKAQANEFVSQFADSGAASAWLQSSLDSVKAQVATLKEKAAAAAPNVKPIADAMLPRIDAEMNTLAAKVTELKNAGPEQWKSIVEQAKPAFDKLNAMVKELSAKLTG